MGSVKKEFKKAVKAVTSPVTGTVKAIGSIAKGDVSGALSNVASAVTMGSVGQEGYLINTNKIIPSTEYMEGKLEEQKQATQKQAQSAQEQAKKVEALKQEDEQRRKSIFFTSGNELGEMLYSTSKKRRGSILGN